MSEEIGSTEDLVNPELTKNIAKDLQEKFLSFNKDGDDVVSTDAVWIEVAKLAILKLYPLAVNSALPHDAQHGSGLNPDAKDQPVGNPSDVRPDKAA